ncbi:hypothetical protein [Microbacterium stercoris]|uniref:Uncharacterized protein n=1 Tax=Microbacterium stercoris TaxID=2820289 RepID=A0A939QNN6_9MICO|nr:hypothetical protein [Microbacterium stercoris]MBO3662063.1 hypothetical protein [Microbacterium stercoris]
MDELTFVRDLGKEIGAPSPAKLAAARAALMIEIERETAEARPVDIASRPVRSDHRPPRDAVAPVTPLEPRPRRAARVGRALLAAAAVLAVAGASFGAVQLFGALKPDERTAGPLPTIDPALVVPGGAYMHVEETRETVSGWGSGSAFGWEEVAPWADVEAAAVLSSDARIDLPRDAGQAQLDGRASEGAIHVSQSERCTITENAGALSGDASAQLVDACRQAAARPLVPGAQPGDAGRQESVIPDGDTAYREAPWVLGDLAGMWSELPVDRARLEGTLRERMSDSNVETLMGTPAALAVAALGWNVAPDTFVDPLLEIIAQLPDARVEREGDRIVRVEATEQDGGGKVEASYIVEVDRELGTVATVKSMRSLDREPSEVERELPGEGAWGERITTIAYPVDEPEPPVDPADLSTWQITGQGIGPFAIGAPWADAVARVAELGGDTSSAGDAGSCGVIWVTKGEVMVNVYTGDGGTVSSVRTEYSGPNGPATQAPATENGLTLHSKVEDVKAAYPGFVDTAGNELTGPFLTVMAGEGNRIHFGYAAAGGGDITDAGDVWAIEVNQLDVLPYEHCDGGGSGEEGGGAGEMDPANWEITSTGIGPIQLGVPLEEAAAALGAEVVLRSDDSYGCDLFTFGTISAGGTDGFVRSIWVFAPGDNHDQRVDPASLPRTVDGIGIGVSTAVVTDTWGPSNAQGSGLNPAWVREEGNGRVAAFAQAAGEGDDNWINLIQVLDSSPGAAGSCFD